MAQKTITATKPAPKPMSAALQALVVSAAAVGYAIATGYSDAVSLVRKIGVRDGECVNATALSSAGSNYNRGYVARYLETHSPAIAKRWGNMDLAHKSEEALAVIAKPTPTETRKPGQRTDLEHKAVRAAQKSWALVKREAGIAASKGGGRAPRTSSNEPEPPRDALFAAPKFDNDNAAREYLTGALASLLTTTEVNQQTGSKKDVKTIMFKVQSIIADAKLAIERALA